VIAGRFHPPRLRRRPTDAAHAPPLADQGHPRAATESYRDRMASVRAPRFGPVQVTRLAGNLDWTPEQAVALLEQGYPAERVATRTGYDLRWLTAQQRRLTRT